MDLDIWLAVLRLLGFDSHLRTGFKIARLLRLYPLALYGFHHAFLVCLKVLSELTCPIDLLAHVVHNLGKAHQVLHGGAEAGLFGGFGEGIAFEVLVLQ